MQVSPSNGPSCWQEDYEKFSRQNGRIASVEAAE
jgi:formate dehydrogenase major subunit